jgi:hypothetical protein
MSACPPPLSSRIEMLKGTIRPALISRLFPLSAIRSFPTVSPGTRSGEIPAPGGTPPRIQASQKPRFWFPRKKRGPPKNFALSAALGFSSFASAGERHLSLYGAR